MYMYISFCSFFFFIVCGKKTVYTMVKAWFSLFQTKTAVEHNEELKLKAKYPGLKTGGGAGSALLQKRLHKGGVSKESC